MAIVYVAGPIFNTHERWYLEQIAARLEQAGYETFLPHRDVGVIGEFTPAERARIFQADLSALDACAFCVALLTGADHDSGTCVELGYLFARGKPCFGLTDDRRWMNNMIWGVCDGGKRIVARLDDLLPLIASIQGT